MVMPDAMPMMVMEGASRGDASEHRHCQSGGENTGH